MPYKNATLKLKLSREQDRRIKLSDDDRKLIAELRQDGFSYNSLATMFGVSKRLVIFICKPETLTACKERRAERGGWSVYYDVDRNTKAVRDNRRYRQKLYLRGEL